MTDAGWSLSDLGIHSGEQQVLRRYLDEVRALLESEGSSLPSREHPVLRRMLITFPSTDPVSELELRLTHDPAVIGSLARTVARTSNGLHNMAPLSSAARQDLATSLVATRIFLSWRLGRLGLPDVEGGIRNIAKDGAGKDQLAARTWLWSGLVLARLSGEADPGDLDFGL